MAVSGEVAPLQAASEQNPDGHATIRAPAGDSEIVITTTNRLAGAIDSLSWGGKEFIDSFDHGRQLQSASNLDEGKTPFHPETFNPTEAGSRADHTGPTSSSRLLQFRTGDSWLESTTRMAFWLAPGEKSLGQPARNRTVLSDHLLTRRVQIGREGLPHAITYDVTFTVPEGEHHTIAQFEALTGYMPPEFSRFLRFLPATGSLEPLDDGPGEQSDPVVFSTPDGSHAMGIYSPDQPSTGFEHAGYGRFRFQAERVVKWNCVFRVRDPEGIEPGDYSYRMFLAVGTLADVRRTLEQLHKDEGKTAQRFFYRPFGSSSEPGPRSIMIGQNDQANSPCTLGVAPWPPNPVPIVLGRSAGSPSCSRVDPPRPPTP
ncbi:hypothetical protein BH23PLA1_BH23PLA1_29370 [soil metagenome]